MRRSFEVGGVAIGLMLGGAVAQGGEYQSEVTASYGSAKSDRLETTIMAVGGAYYLSPVSSDGGPLAESTFLNPASGVLAVLGRGESDYKDNALKLTGDVNVLGLRLAEKGQPLVAEVIFARVSLSDTGVDVDSNGFSLGLDYYARKNVTVGLLYGEDDYEVKEAGVANSNSETAITGVNAKWLHLGTATYSLAGGYSSEKTTGDNPDSTNAVIGIDFDYYLDNTLSVGFGYENNSGDDKADEGDTLSLRLNKFVTDMVSLEAGYSDFNAKDSVGGDDETSFFVQLTNRF